MYLNLTKCSYQFKTIRHYQVHYKSTYTGKNTFVEASVIYQGVIIMSSVALSKKIAFVTIALLFLSTLYPIIHKACAQSKPVPNTHDIYATDF